jgi:hypothetical protein
VCFQFGIRAVAALKFGIRAVAALSNPQQHNSGDSLPVNVTKWTPMSVGNGRYNLELSNKKIFVNCYII